MCSILGIIDFDKKKQDKELEIKKINNLLKHRGPDDEGFYTDEYVSLAFNRLSILDLQKGNQPIKNNHIISIFNGEIYNFKEVRKELEGSGFKFKTNSDSEIIPAAFLKWGIECISKFNGMFAISIYDLNEKKLYLIRDRVGIKPLYYSLFNGLLVFASEISGIINHSDFKRSVNFNALASYLSFRYPLGKDNNFFKNIQKVQSGNFLEIDINKKKIIEKEYWALPKIEAIKNFSEKYYLEKLECLLTDSVKKHLISDVPVGVLLSGGLDSSIISSITSNFASGHLKTFSVGFKEKKYDEGSKAKLIAKYIGSDHTEVIVEKNEFFENLLNIIKIKNAPLSIPHEYPIYKLSKKIKESVKVVLSGEGADEFFGGYARIQKSAFDFIKAKNLKFFSNSRFFKKIFSIDSEFNFQKNDFSDYFFYKYNWFSFNEIDNLINKNISDQINIEKVKEPWIAILKKYKSCSKYDQSLLMFQANHLQCLLDRLDVMTMANSVEARVPFLDHELIEFINTVPFKFKIKWKSKMSKFKSLFSNNFKFSEIYDINKYLLRKIGEKHLPKKISSEKKLGFPLPMDDWMKDSRVKEILLDKKTLDRKIFNKNMIEKLIDSENKVKDPYDFSGKKIWMLINFELWMRTFID